MDGDTVNEQQVAPEQPPAAQQERINPDEVEFEVWVTGTPRAGGRKVGSVVGQPTRSDLFRMFGAGRFYVVPKWRGRHVEGADWVTIEEPAPVLKPEQRPHPESMNGNGALTGTLSDQIVLALIQNMTKPQDSFRQTLEMMERMKTIFKQDGPAFQPDDVRKAFEQGVGIRKMLADVSEEKPDVDGLLHRLVEMPQIQALIGQLISRVSQPATEIPVERVSHGETA